MKISFLIVTNVHVIILKGFKLVKYLLTDLFLHCFKGLNKQKNKTHRHRPHYSDYQRERESWEGGR